MKLKSESIFLLVLLTVALVFLVYALRYQDLQMKLLPLAIGGIVLMLMIYELSRELMAGRKSRSATLPESGTPETGIAQSELPGYLKGWGWMVGYLLGILLIGFYVGTALFIFTYLKMNRRRWFVSVGTGALAIACLYTIFAYGLRADMFPGLLFGRSL